MRLQWMYFFVATLGVLPFQTRAEVRGTAGAASSSIFRGIPYTTGAMIDGSIRQVLGNWHSGARLANCDVCGGSEINMFAGWNKRTGDTLQLDAGIVVNLFPEADEQTGLSRNYAEIFGGIAAYGLHLQFFLADEYRGGLSRGGAQNRDGYHARVSYDQPLVEKLDAQFAVGYSWGDGVTHVMGSHYLDYRAALTKQLTDAWHVSLSLTGTDLRLANGQRDQPKFVVGAQRSFSF